MEQRRGSGAGRASGGLIFDSGESNEADSYRDSYRDSNRDSNRDSDRADSRRDSKTDPLLSDVQPV